MIIIMKTIILFLVLLIFEVRHFAMYYLDLPNLYTIELGTNSFVYSDSTILESRYSYYI